MVSYTVRTREYESVKVELGAELNHYDLGYTDDELAKLASDSYDALWVELWNTLAQELQHQTQGAMQEVARIYPGVNLATDIIESMKHIRKEQNAHRATQTKPGRTIPRPSRS
jgi:hypothetical protein